MENSLLNFRFRGEYLAITSGDIILYPEEIIFQFPEPEIEPWSPVVRNRDHKNKISYFIFILIFHFKLEVSYFLI